MREPTPLVELPELARLCRVASVLVKDEGQRPLGSFKALGGVYAGLRALARATGAADIQSLVAQKSPELKLPKLICASDGNHGLAVAAAAELVGAPAAVFLHEGVPQARARRIAQRGAEIVWVAGTYDDAVDAALAMAQRGEGLMISDTSSDAADPVTADVMAGYLVMADEIAQQLKQRSHPTPTHLFVQAGVGGLAAALAQGLCEKHRLACRIVVVEPASAACVGSALASGQIERLSGALHTAAEMLSCGEASAPAVEILRRVGANAMAVSEPLLLEAVETLSACGGPATTPSGAAGLAGLISVRQNAQLSGRLAVDDASRILLIASEGVSPEE